MSENGKKESRKKLILSSLVVVEALFPFLLFTVSLFYINER